MNSSNVASQAVTALTSTSSSWITVTRWLFEASKMFWKPTDFLKQRVDKPKNFIPYILVIVISFIFTAATVDIAFRERVAQLQGIDITSVPPRGLPIKIMVAAPRCVVGWLAPLAFVLCVWGCSNLLKLRRVNKQELLSILSIILYGEVIYHLGSFFRMAMILVKNTTHVSVSLGVVALKFGCDLTSVLYRLSTKFDLFLIWEIIIVGVGLSMLYGCSRRKAYLLSALSIELIPVLWILK